jgi:hypothetical protein
MSNIPNNVIVTEDTANRVIVNQDAPNQVVVRFGTQIAGNTRRFIFTQEAAALNWVITHTLGGFPSVTIVDSANTHVFGEVIYNSTSQITVLFSAAFSGKAYLT